MRCPQPQSLLWLVHCTILAAVDLTAAAGPGRCCHFQPVSGRTCWCRPAAMAAWSILHGDQAVPADGAGGSGGKRPAGWTQQAFQRSAGWRCWVCLLRGNAAATAGMPAGGTGGHELAPPCTQQMACLGSHHRHLPPHGASTPDAAATACMTPQRACSQAACSCTKQCSAARRYHGPCMLRWTARLLVHWADCSVCLEQSGAETGTPYLT